MVDVVAQNIHFINFFVGVEAANNLKGQVKVPRKIIGSSCKGIKCEGPNSRKTQIYPTNSVIHNNEILDT